MGAIFHYRLIVIDCHIGTIILDYYGCSCDFDDFITICVPWKFLIMSYSTHCCIIVAESYCIIHCLKERWLWLYWQQLLKSPCFNRSWCLRSSGFCNNSISRWSRAWPCISTLSMASRGYPQFIWPCFVSFTWVFPFYFIHFPFYLFGSTISSA
jgi:hypothetical protein